METTDASIADDPRFPAKPLPLTEDEKYRRHVQQNYGPTGDPQNPNPGGGMQPTDTRDGNRRPMTGIDDGSNADVDPVRDNYAEKREAADREARRARGEKVEDERNVTEDVRQAKSRRQNREQRLTNRNKFIDDRSNELMSQFPTLAYRFSMRELVEAMAIEGKGLTVEDKPDLKAVSEDNPSISERNSDNALIAEPRQPPSPQASEGKFGVPFVPTDEGGVGNPTAAPQSNQVGTPPMPQFLTQSANAIEHGRTPDPVTGAVQTSPVQPIDGQQKMPNDKEKQNSKR